MNTYKLTLLAILSALAVAGRYAFTFLPNVQPVTAIIIIGGLFLGPGMAFVMAFLITFLSNMLLGMGIWTIWQVIAWGVIGIASGLLGRWIHSLRLSIIVLFAVFSGYFYGFMISFVTYQFSGHFWPYYIAGLPFDTMHAVGNGIFVIILYPIFSKLLAKYSNDRFQTYSTANRYRQKEYKR